ncbi:MAG: hypothetical protein NDP13_04895 [Crenarchaeota archaeon]|nr:hypothetical protein [Thermoproteota archaeon]MCR8454304.1 hypothetical protein [Thermoproteota archaeon]MCR8455072.1 hypothetical protein [Thermoproteota archaeon]MCR8463365.1 hypothetical protein [Thermoproteota archaeon]MCR8470812.1 hypothetical protein [Thermoproteota archaeon]
MRADDARQKLTQIVSSIGDQTLQKRAIKALSDYLKTRNIVEKRVYRARVITFYAEWLKKQNDVDRKEKISLLKKLLHLVRK